MYKGFFAYPSEPLHIGEVIENFIKQINESNIAKIASWKGMKVSGSVIISEICKCIDECDIFCCDITYLNANVLFELGYAIAKDKKIWITLDYTILKAKENYKKLPFSGVGYSPYANMIDLLTEFDANSPFSNNQQITLYKQLVEPAKETARQTQLLYIKCGIDSEASMRLTSRIKKTRLNKVTDDQKEIYNQPLSWYVQHTSQAIGVIAHFRSNDQLVTELDNAMPSLICGMAYGFGLKLLMLAHSPYESPLDYKDILKIHQTAAECEDFADIWLSDIEQEVVEQGKIHEDYQAAVKGYQELKNIYIGDGIAENEQDELDRYFVETGSYMTALQARQLLFTGRKGTGKTANLMKIAEETARDKRNHVCIIAPPTYDIEGITKVLEKTMGTADRGYLVESFWKYLIYSELARSVYLDLEHKLPSTLTNQELEFMRYAEKNRMILLEEFSIRINDTIKVISDITEQQSQPMKISELLHDNIIKYLRSQLGLILKNKNKVLILVDNLDKTWDTKKDLTVLGEFLLGLLGVSRRVEEDLRGKDRWRDALQLSLIIYIRSDIFYEISKRLREKDKLRYFELSWADPVLLQRVIETRFDYANNLPSPEEMWKRYFCSNVKGIPTKEYITSVIQPRPRDMIYFCSVALSEAVNRAHPRIEEADIISAEKQYSKNALYSLVAENAGLEDLYYEFLGCCCVIAHDELLTIIAKCETNLQADTDVINILCKNGFLGLEVEKNIFEFLGDEENQEIVLIKARKFIELDHDKRYCINRPFHAYLEILESDRMIKREDFFQWVYIKK